MNKRPITLVATLAALATLMLLTACAGAVQTPGDDITAEPPHLATEVQNGGPDGPVNSDTPAATAEPGKPGGDVEIGTAVVDSIELLMLESFPVQIDVVLKGNLPDGCTQIGEITQLLDDSNRYFTLKVSTTRPKDMACTEALVPYEKHVRLDGVVGLPKGIYTVSANGTTATFDMQMDNGPLATP